MTCKVHLKMFFIFLSLQLLNLSHEVEGRQSVNEPFTTGPCARTPQCRCKWFEGKRMADCSNSGLRSIPTSLNPDIQTLVLDNNPLDTLSSEVFKIAGLVDVQSVSLKRCQLRYVDEDAFRSLRILTHLDLSYNNISRLQDKSFDGNRRLSSLILSHNEINALTFYQFPPLSSLKSIDISHNNLQEIDVTAFKNLGSSVESLLMDHNQLSTLSEYTFESLINLKYITLHSNNWLCDCLLKNFRDFVIRRNLYNHPIACSQPSRLEGKSWERISASDFACKPNTETPAPIVYSKPYAAEVTMACLVSGSPIPSIRWVVHDRIINNNTFSKASTDDDELTLETHGYSSLYVIKSEKVSVDGFQQWYNLTIYSPTESDVGKYICVAENNGGMVEQVVELSFDDNPAGIITGGSGIPLTDEQLTIIIAAGIALILICLIILCVCFYCLCRDHQRMLKNSKDHQTNYYANTQDLTGNTTLMGDFPLNRSVDSAAHYNIEYFEPRSNTSHGSVNAYNSLPKPPRQFDTLGTSTPMPSSSVMHQQLLQHYCTLGGSSLPSKASYRKFENDRHKQPVFNAGEDLSLLSAVDLDSNNHQHGKRVGDNLIVDEGCVSGSSSSGGSSGGESRTDDSLNSLMKHKKDSSNSTCSTLSCAARPPSRGQRSSSRQSPYCDNSANAFIHPQQYHLKSRSLADSAQASLRNAIALSEYSRGPSPLVANTSGDGGSNDVQYAPLSMNRMDHSASGYVTLPRRPRTSWSISPRSNSSIDEQQSTCPSVASFYSTTSRRGPACNTLRSSGTGFRRPFNPQVREAIYDGVGPRTSADGSSKTSLLHKSSATLCRPHKKSSCNPIDEDYIMTSATIKSAANPPCTSIMSTSVMSTSGDGEENLSSYCEPFGKALRPPSGRDSSGKVTGLDGNSSSADEDDDDQLTQSTVVDSYVMSTSLMSALPPEVKMLRVGANGQCPPPTLPKPKMKPMPPPKPRLTSMNLSQIKLSEEADENSVAKVDFINAKSSEREPSLIMLLEDDGDLIGQDQEEGGSEV